MSRASINPVVMAVLTSARILCAIGHPWDASGYIMRRMRDRYSMKKPVKIIKGNGIVPESWDDIEFDVGPPKFVG